MSVSRNLVLSNEDKIFTLYRDYEVVGGEMKDDFFRSKYTMAKDPDRFVFKMSVTNEKEGILGLSYGVFLMSVLLDRFKLESKFNLEEKKKLEQSIVQLLNYVEEHGFDVTPFGRSSANTKLFGWKKDQYSFIESLTWALSCFLYAKRLNETGALRLEQYMPEITKWIAKCLGILLENVICANGEVGYKEGRTDYIGWGPVTGCVERSLYFTHSVCETFGDIEDTMLGNEELDIPRARDNKYIAQINAEYEKLKSEKGRIKGDIVECFKEVCLCVGKNLYEQYKDKLGKQFFYADGSGITSVEQISYSLQSPVLLNQLYVALSIVYVNYHKEVKSRGEEAYKEFSTSLKNAVDMVYETFDELHRRGKSNIVNRDYAMFTEKHPNKEIGQLLANERITVAILETLIIKAKAMMVTYVSKYPEKEIGEVLTVLDMTRSKEDGWLWSDMGYDLQHTERSISAIREFYDYYENFQKVCATKAADDIQALEKMYKEKEQYQKSVVEDAKRNYEQQLREIRAQYERELSSRIEEVRSGYKLEAVVREIVETQIKELFADILVGTFDRIAEDNKSAKNTQLSESDERIKAVLEKLVFSYLIPFHFGSNRGDGYEKWKNEKLLRAMKSDLGYFVQEWMDRVCINNAKDSELSVQVLSELFQDTNTYEE